MEDDTIPATFFYSAAILEARSRSRPIRSRGRSMVCWFRALASATNSGTLSDIGLTFLNNLEAAASALLVFEAR